MKIACTIVALGAAFLASGLLVGNEAEAQFCALRQPTLAFQEAFEEGTAMRSFDREVTEEHREIIAEVLPFTLNRRELGTHTLYAGMSEREEVRGYLHVRSERDKWGLTELAWEIGPDLTIQGLTVQRTRSAGKDYLESSRFLSLVKGKGLREIRTLLSDDGGELTETVGLRWVPPMKPMLASDFGRR